MLRTLTLATLFAVLSGAVSGQTLVVLHIKVTVADAAGTPMPVARHALLISDNPSTSAPRRVVTTADGTADVRLRPGNYTVESDEPFNLAGKSFQWTETLDVRAGRDVVLELTARNAEVGAASARPASSGSTASNEDDVLSQWQDSLVSIWTPQARATGFIVDASGLVVTNQRVVGSATAVDVQLTPSIKVTARVLAADRERDVAVLWIDPATTATVRPVPLGCSGGAKAPIPERQRLVGIGAPLRGPKAPSFGSAANLRFETGSTGGPIFTADGVFVGMSSVADDQDERRRRDARIVPAEDICAVVGLAEKARQTAQAPAATRLPVEPQRTVPAATLDEAVQRRVGNLSPYQMSAADFDIAFFTPVLIKGAKATEFGDWSEYFADVPTVLVVRVTPKMTESFWTTVARGAAYTQGAAIPAIKHFKPGFSRMQAFCGDVEVMPIHPFILERRVSETDGTRVGLYVFDPQAFGPQCKSVKFVLSSEKVPAKPDTRTVDPKVIERIGQDFAGVN